MVPVVWQQRVKQEQKSMMKEINRQIARNFLEQAQEDEEKGREGDLPDIQKEMLPTMEPEPSYEPEPAMEQEEADAQEEFAGLDLVEEEEKPLTEKEKTIKAILNGQKLLGILEIDKLDIVFPIVEGTERGNIRAAIGHMKKTALPGQEGNCVLAGHRGGIYGEFFKNIHKLKKGDTVALTDLNGIIYTYMVYEQFIVEPQDIWVVDEIGGKTLTLVSCEKNGTKRLIVRCSLAEEK